MLAKKLTNIFVLKLSVDKTNFVENLLGRRGFGIIDGASCSGSTGHSSLVVEGKEYESDILS